MARTRLLALAAAALLTAAVAAPASAADPATCSSGWDKIRTCSVTASSGPNDPGTGSHDGQGGPATKPATCEDSFPSTWCTPKIPGGWWSSSSQCWVAQLNPQPAAGDPLWKGNTTGAVYSCEGPVPPAFRGTSDITFFWSDTLPQQVDPAVLAQTAIDSMDLSAPAVGATPLPGPEAVSLIGLPTWLWIGTPDEHTWGPITRTATAGAVTTTATATVTEVVWDMGDGSTVTCANTGTAWTPAQGTGDSPSCGYRYNAPGKRTITATTHWQVDWSGAGQSGVIPLTLAGSRQIDVVELRAVISR
jgi:hypothetical protein